MVVQGQLCPNGRPSSSRERAQVMQTFAKACDNLYRGGVPLPLVAFPAAAPHKACSPGTPGEGRGPISISEMGTPVTERSSPSQGDDEGLKGGRAGSKMEPMDVDGGSTVCGEAGRMPERCGAVGGGGGGRRGRVGGEEVGQGKGEGEGKMGEREGQGGERGRGLEKEEKGVGLNGGSVQQVESDMCEVKKDVGATITSNDDEVIKMALAACAVLEEVQVMCPEDDSEPAGGGSRVAGGGVGGAGEGGGGSQGGSFAVGGSRTGRSGRSGTRSGRSGLNLDAAIRRPEDEGMDCVPEWAGGGGGGRRSVVLDVGAGGEAEEAEYVGGGGEGAGSAGTGGLAGSQEGGRDAERREREMSEKCGCFGNPTTQVMPLSFSSNF